MVQCSIFFSQRFYCQLLILGHFQKPPCLTWSRIRLAAKNDTPIHSPPGGRCGGGMSQASPCIWPRGGKPRKRARSSRAVQSVGTPGAAGRPVDQIASWGKCGGRVSLPSAWTDSREWWCVDCARNPIAQGCGRVRMTTAFAAAGEVRMRALPERSFLLCPLEPTGVVQVVDYRMVEELERVNEIEPS